MNIETYLSIELNLAELLLHSVGGLRSFGLGHPTKRSSPPQQQQQQQQQQQGTNNHCGPVLLLCFYLILQTKTVAPLLFWPPPPWNNLSAIPFLCFFFILQTKTAAPCVVLTPPLQQPFYKQRLWPLVLFWPPLSNNPLTRWCWIDDHSQDDVE